MTLSNRDKKLLLVLAGILLFAASYFWVYSPLSKQTAELKSKNEALQVQLDRLTQLEASLLDYEKEIEKINDEIEKLTAEFPAATREEDGILFGYDMEKNQDEYLQISTITLGNSEPVIATTVVRTENIGNVQDMGNGAEGTTGTVSEYTMYCTSNGYVYTADYKGLKDFIKAVNGYTDKVTIQSLNASFDSSTGRLAGTMQLNFFTMDGTVREYTAPKLPSVGKGTNNLFKTTN